jgi:DNA-binding response OmpR family regulator
MKKELLVVVIEDDPVYCLLLSRYLRGNLDCKVIRFDNAISCLHTADLHADLVFIDLMMRDMDGLRASKVLRRKWKNAGVILMSSNDKVFNLNLKSYGVDLAFKKDMHLKEIIRRALRLLRVRRIMRWLPLIFSGILVVSFIVSLFWFFY